MIFTREEKMPVGLRARWQLMPTIVVIVIEMRVLKITIVIMTIDFIVKLC